ncbi:MAG TPA: hypothetical protein VIJ94_00970 [Caulobacteraceae bacterium]
MPEAGTGPGPGQENDAGPGAGHNADAREASLIFHMDQLRTIQAQIDAAMVPVKALQKIQTTRRNAAAGATWTLEILDRALKRERQSNRRQLAKVAEEEAFVARTMNLPFGNAEEQLDMFHDAPQEEKDEHFWGQDGYNRGLRGLMAKAPPELPPAFLQTWLKRHAAGAERLSWSQSEQGHSPDRPPSGAERERLTGGVQGDEGKAAAGGAKAGAKETKAADEPKEGEPGHNPKDPLLN